MAAIYADAAAFGFKALSQEPLIHAQEPETDIQNKFPGKKTAQATQNLEDFIVIAEFSEVTGPIPLLTIPSNIAESKTFDINNFIMKIMSVDYQANPGGHFQTCEDVQVLTCEARRSAYVHYTMVHDLRARGWVRPFCIAYISSNAVKLQSNFDSLRKMFLQITEILKYNNCQWFQKEIHRALDTLRENQIKYFNYKKKEVDGFDLSPEEESAMGKLDIDMIVHQYTEYQHLLHVVEQTLDRVNCGEAINFWKDRLFSEIHVPQVASYVSRHYCEESVANEVPLQENLTLKAILALCPWGFAAALWCLLLILKTPSIVNLDKKLSSMFSQPYCIDKMKGFVDDALRSTEYLDLLVAPLQLIKPNSIESSDSTLDANLFSSANETTGSSSYHSVAESLSDLPRDMEQMSDNESYLDISETFHTDESDGSSEDEICRESTCYWTPVVNNEHRVITGHCLLRFFWKYEKVVCPILYSLLIGRTVVISGNENSRRRVGRLIRTLTPLVPVSDTHPLNKLPWQCGILVSSHIIQHQVIGLCVPERLSIHDMISPKDKNKLSILDIESKQFFGPAYSGNFLSSLGKVIPNVTDDHGLQLYIQYVAASVAERVHVYKAVLSECPQSKPSSILKDLKLQGCDSEIVKFFSTLN